MLILSLDSAGTGCSACVWRDGKVIATADERMERGQDQRLMPMIMGVMQKAGIAFPSLNRIAVTRGPGSFTGIRIGLAAARGVGLAAEKLAVGIDRFAIYRAQIETPGKNLLAIIDSKRKELFCRFYPVQGLPTEPCMMTPDEIAAFLTKHRNTICAGDAKVAGIDMLPPSEIEAVTAARLAAEADPADPAFLPRPLYIRAPDVTMRAS